MRSGSPTRPDPGPRPDPDRPLPTRSRPPTSGPSPGPGRGAPLRVLRAAIRIAGDLLAPVAGLVVPHLCEVCGDRIEAPEALCDGCRGRLQSDRVGDGPPEEVAAGATEIPLHAALRYEGEVAHRVMQRFKYGGARILARPLGRAMARTLREGLGARAGPGGVVLVPVPASPERRRLRGYDQARLLAEEVGGILGHPVADLLTRRPGVSSQTRLGVRDRERNLTGVFAARPRTPYCPVVLIDDVWTTGATLSACQGALESAGHPVVAGVVAFRTPRRRPASAGAVTSPSRGHPREKGHVS